MAPPSHMRIHWGEGRNPYPGQGARYRRIEGIFRGSGSNSIQSAPLARQIAHAKCTRPEERPLRLFPAKEFALSMITDLSSLRERSLARVRSTPLVRSILSGDVQREAYARYMTDVHQYAQHSPVVIAMAGARAAATNPDVARYLIHHASEELGHDRWARADLESLGVSAAEIDSARPSAPCMAMIGLEYYWA